MFAPHPGNSSSFALISTEVMRGGDESILPVAVVSTQRHLPSWCEYTRSRMCYQTALGQPNRVATIAGCSRQPLYTGIPDTFSFDSSALWVGISVACAISSGTS